MRRATFSFLLAHLLACDGVGACTEAECVHRAVVSFPGAIAGPYDLTISDGISGISARCNDPELGNGVDNPAEVTCSASGFELVGHTLSNARTVRVTVVDDDGDAVYGNVEVFLDVVDTVQPNGPNCEPTCYVRNGQVLVPGEG